MEDFEAAQMFSILMMIKTFH